MTIPLDGTVTISIESPSVVLPVNSDGLLVYATTLDNGYRP